MKKIELSSTTATYLAVSLVAAMAISFAGIVPSYRALAGIKNRIDEKQLEIERQEVLFPLLMTLIKEVQEKPPQGFPIPRGPQATPKELGQLESIFSQTARYNHMVLKEMRPDTQSYLGESPLLKIELVFSGHFDNIRRLLLNICALPYLDQIEKFSILPEKDGRLQVKLRLALRRH